LEYAELKQFDRPIHLIVS